MMAAVLESVLYMAVTRAGGLDRAEGALVVAVRLAR
jgi:hypothetical protein